MSERKDISPFLKWLGGIGTGVTILFGAVAWFTTIDTSVKHIQEHQHFQDTQITSLQEKLVDTNNSVISLKKDVEYIKQGIDRIEDHISDYGHREYDRDNKK